jgi:hypothetical protein
MKIFNQPRRIRATTYLLRNLSYGIQILVRAGVEKRKENYPQIAQILWDQDKETFSDQFGLPRLSQFRLNLLRASGMMRARWAEAGCGNENKIRNT